MPEGQEGQVCRRQRQATLFITKETARVRSIFDRTTTHMTALLEGSAQSLGICLVSDFFVQL